MTGSTTPIPSAPIGQSIRTLDPTSLLVQVEAKITLGTLEGYLIARGLTLGALPRASLARTLGAALAAPRASEATPRGRLLDACAGIEGILPDGTLFSTRLAPRRATGPDPAHAILGSRGSTAMITAAWLRCRRRSANREFTALAAPSREAAFAIASELLRTGARPADLALVDGNRCGALLGVGEDLSSQEVLAVILFDGPPELCRAESEIASGLAKQVGARPLPDELAERWFRDGGAPTLAERFVPMRDLRSDWGADGEGGELVALRPAGGALRHPAIAPSVARPALRDLRERIAATITAAPRSEP